MRASQHRTHRCCSADVGLGSCCRRAISLYEAMRWRGVSVMSRLGQLLSQKPHSMQWSTISEATGDGFRCLMCRLGSYMVAAKNQHNVWVEVGYMPTTVLLTDHQVSD